MRKPKVGNRVRIIKSWFREELGLEGVRIRSPRGSDPKTVRIHLDEPYPPAPPTGYIIGDSYLLLEPRSGEKPACVLMERQYPCDFVEAIGNVSKQ